MFNPFKVLGKEIKDVASGDLPIRDDLKAPDAINGASSKETLEAYRQYSVNKNLLADRVGFVERIIEKFAGILLGASATFFGVFLGTGRSEVQPFDPGVLSGAQSDALDAYVQDRLSDTDLTPASPTYDSQVEMFRNDFFRSDAYKETLSEEKGSQLEEWLEASAESGGSNTLFMAGMVVMGSLALSFVGLLFKQFVTRELTDKGAYTNDYYRKAQAEEIAKEIEPVVERQVNKNRVCGKEASWEGLMDPEALRAIQEAENNRV